MPSVSKLNEVKQVQDDVIVSDERQTKMLNEKRLKDGNMNSRGLLSPRFLWLYNNGVCKDGERQRVWGIGVRVFTDAN